MNRISPTISKEQTDVIKGIAITLIVFHNYLHWTNGIGENEMNFDANRILRLASSVLNSPSMIINGLISYFGHYGVQLFIFISGYGLTKTYAKSGTFSYKNYFKTRLKKVYSLLIFAIITLLIFDLTTQGLSVINMVYVENILLTLTTFRNFWYDTIYIFSGPWWFFGLIIQLYLVFPLLLYISKRFGQKGIFLIILSSYVLSYILYPISEINNIAYYGNFIGHLPEFMFGVLIAMFPISQISKIFFPITVIIFVLSNFIYIFFPLSFLSITIILLTIIYHLNRIMPKKLFNIFSSLGKISMFIFVYNGIIRLFTIQYGIDTSPMQTLISSIFHFIIVIIVSRLFSEIYKKTMAFLK